MTHVSTETVLISQTASPDMSIHNIRNENTCECPKTPYVEYIF